MNSAEIGRLILQESRRKKGDILRFYTKHYKDVFVSLANFDGVVSDLKIKNENDFLDQVRFGAFANDITILTLPPGGEAKIKIPAPGSRNDEFLGTPIKFEVRSSDAERYVTADGKFNGVPALVIRSDAYAARTIDTLAPLMMRGRTIVRPQRAVLTHQKLGPDGRNYWQLTEVEPSSPFDHWRTPALEAVEPSIPMAFEGSKSPGEVALYDLTFPFLSGIKLYDLAILLEEEEHHISKARVALRKMIAEARAGGSDLPSVANDLIRPELDALTRRLRTISQTRSLKQGGAILAMVTMGLTAVFTGGLPQIAAAVGSAGTGGLLLNELAGGLEKRRQEEEHPLYLLWRLKNLRRES